MSQWPHAPLHVFVPNAVYMITAGTHEKQHLLDTGIKLGQVESRLHEIFARFGWEVRAWAVLSNHYHVIARAPEAGGELATVIRRFHSVAAADVNRVDGTPGRRVWFQYWDRCLTYEKSYLARLNYVNQNAVRHGLVRVAADYPFCSAAHFERTAKSSFVRTVESFKWDQLNEPDEYVPLWSAGA